MTTLGAAQGGTVHVYTARSHPATRWRDDVAARYGLPMRYRWHTNPPNRPLWTSCCRKRRPAKNLVVQVYYDALRVYCAPGKGCKR